MVYPRLALLALCLSACDGDSDRKSLASPTQASAWEIGPINSRGHNYSQWLPLHPTQFADGFGFTISPTAEPHYITYRHGPLTGKTRIRMRYRVEGEPATVIHGAKCPTNTPSAVVLYFERGGDNFSDDGYRWWATFAVSYLTGPTEEREIVAPLDAKWTSVIRMNAVDNPGEFATAKRDADRVGFTFANCIGWGHGALATAPVRFIVTHYSVE